MLLSTGGYNSFLDLITVLFIFVFVIIVTLFTTKYIANYQKVQNAGRNIEVLETYRLSQSKYIQIVKIGKKKMALAVTKDNITMLSTLEDDDVSFEDDMGERKSFKEIMASLKKTKVSNEGTKMTEEKLENINSPEEE